MQGGDDDTQNGLGQPTYDNHPDQFVVQPRNTNPHAKTYTQPINLATEWLPKQRWWVRKVDMATKTTKNKLKP